jgi:hypothetical protein
MLKCLHVVITMAFIYPVLAATYPTLMAIAKQYSAVKQGSIYYGGCAAQHLQWHRRNLSLACASAGPDQMTFACAAVRATPTASMNHGAMWDTMDIRIDDLFRLVRLLVPCGL